MNMSHQSVMAAGSLEAVVGITSALPPTQKSVILGFFATILT